MREKKNLNPKDMTLLTFPVAQSKQTISAILNCGRLKSPVKLIYPNKMIVDSTDLPAIKTLLKRNQMSWK
jgi:hypothetical protein